LIILVDEHNRDVEISLFEDHRNGFSLKLKSISVLLLSKKVLQEGFNGGFDFSLSLIFEEVVAFSSLGSSRRAFCDDGVHL
jgi:hypothetical protein